MFLPFKTHLSELALSLLKANAFLEVFHVPILSWQGCSQEFLAQTIKLLGVREHH